jgi:hypothetical protein
MVWKNRSHTISSTSMKQCDNTFVNYSSIALMIVAFMTGCSWQVPEDASNGVTRNLIESFDKTWVSSDRERYVFHDPVVKNTHLISGWEFDQNASHSRFPWPRFTDSPANIQIIWKHRMERRIFIKLLNIKDSYHDNLFFATLNGHALPVIDSDLPVGEYEFYIPSGFQKIGTNMLTMVIDQDRLPSEIQAESIGLHSLRVTLGAVVRSRIQIGDQARDSLLFAPPAKLHIPYESGIRKNLQFSYGLYSSLEDSDDFRYLLKISLYENLLSRPVFEKSMPIQRNTTSKSAWQSMKEALPVLNQNGILELSFHSDQDVSAGIDYLALSEIFLSPETHSWELRTDSAEPDVLFFTMSSVSANQLGVYGNPDARTPFLDNLSKTAMAHTDVTAVGNSEIASVISMKSGQYARDHGFYRDFSDSNELPDMVSQLNPDSRYQRHAFVYTRKAAQSVFAKIPGFRRIYLSNPSSYPPEIVREQLAGILNTPYVIANPAFFWFHLAPDKLASDTQLAVFNPDLYGEDPFPVRDLNLPLSEQERIQRATLALGEGDDVRLLLSKNDHRLMILDRLVKQLFIDVLSKRHRRSMAYVISSDHGIIRSLNSNPLSSDSLGQEVLNVPLIQGLISLQESDRNTDSFLVQTPVSSLIIHEILSQLLRKGSSDVLTSLRSGVSPVRPLFAEHNTRPIIAYRRDNYKLIHVFSNPYFQIATTNLYNLDADPGESVNVVGRDSDFTRRYLDIVTAFCRDSPYYPRPRIGFEDEALSLLKSLRYTDE